MERLIFDPLKKTKNNHQGPEFSGFLTFLIKIANSIS